MSAPAAAGAVAASVIVLTMGHVFSNAVRTLPAMTADMLMRDLALTPDALAGLTGIFPAAFAVAMLPVGVALDRYGVRRVALWLLAIGSLGALLAALAPGAAGMVLAQVVLGVGCSGMLMCPMTYAARAMSGPRFALWAGLIQAIGNTGMLLSASPLALLVEWQGWRAGYLACAGLAGLAALAVWLVVRQLAPERGQPSSLWADTRQVLALAASPAMRPMMVIAFASFAAVFGVRGLWGGPWLMVVKGLSRVEAGHVLLGCTVALILGPALAGAVDRALNRRVALLAAGHFAAAALLGLLLAGRTVPGAGLDAVLLFGFGIAISFQVLTFSLVRAEVPPEQTGRALSAMNMAFFGGAAVMQAVSGEAALWGGVGAALGSFAFALLFCTLGFLVLWGGRGRG